MTIPTILIKSVFGMSDLWLGLAFLHDGRKDSKIVPL